jgi:hypothetical protein
MSSYRTTVELRGGPFDGATFPAFGWIEALVLRTETGPHWYVYTGAPPEADDGHDGVLEHHADETLERATCSFDGPALMERCAGIHRDNIAHKLRELRRLMPPESRDCRRRAGLETAAPNHAGQGRRAAPQWPDVRAPGRAGTGGAAMIWHGEVESALRAIAVTQITTLWGRTVWRTDLRHWRVDGSEPVRLLCAIDRLMSKRRARLAFRERSGQNCMVSNGKQGGSG